jgi:hypothetical protein
MTNENGEWHCISPFSCQEEIHELSWESELCDPGEKAWSRIIWQALRKLADNPKYPIQNIKIIPWHAIGVSFGGGGGGLALHILNLDPRCRWVVNATLRPL